jgi:hypothetical protein
MTSVTQSAPPGANKKPLSPKAQAALDKANEKISTESTPGTDLVPDDSVQGEPGEVEIIEADLPELANIANRWHDLAETSMRSALEAAWNAGRALVKAKELCDHGKWLPWLDANFRGSARRAQEYMQIANTRTPAHLEAAQTIDEALTAIRGDNTRRKETNSYPATQPMPPAFAGLKPLGKPTPIRPIFTGGQTITPSNVEIIVPDPVVTHSDATIIIPEPVVTHHDVEKIVVLDEDADEDVDEPAKTVDDTIRDEIEDVTLAANEADRAVSKLRDDGDDDEVIWRYHEMSTENLGSFTEDLINAAKEFDIASGRVRMHVVEVLHAHRKTQQEIADATGLSVYQVHSMLAKISDQDRDRLQAHGVAVYTQLGHVQSENRTAVRIDVSDPRNGQATIVLGLDAIERLMALVGDSLRVCRQDDNHIRPEPPF